MPRSKKELEDCGAVSADDILAAQMTARASDKGVTFVAFTATKSETLERAGYEKRNRNVGATLVAAQGGSVGQQETFSSVSSCRQGLGTGAAKGVM